MDDEAIEYLKKPDYVGYDMLSVQVICEVYLVWNDSGLILASRFEGIKGSDEVEKNCYAVRDKGKVPASMIVSEHDIYQMRH